jgi:hypothetical protein
LLGSSYAASSALSLGSSNRSQEFGISALFSIDRDNSIYLEASQASTRAANPVDGGMFAGTSALRAQSFGMSFTSRNLLAKADRLTVSLKQPLRVTSGTVDLTVTNIDPVTGVPSVGIERVSLAPSGREVDYTLSYATSLSKTQKLAFQAGYVKDSLNITGNNSSSVGMIWSSKF